jgi:hypothetical protein
MVSMPNSSCRRPSYYAQPPASNVAHVREGAQVDSEIAGEVRAFPGSRIGASDLQPGLSLVWNLSSRWAFVFSASDHAPSLVDYPHRLRSNF